jgi:excisionase family DNA binding protein
MQKLAFTIAEVVDCSGIGRSKLYEFIKQGVICPRKAGKRTLILREDLEKFLSNLPASNEGGRK